MKGWKTLIAQTKEKLLSIPLSEQLIIGKTYEKYGSLRFDLNFYNESIDKIIDDAEEKSERLCIRCGSEAKLRTKREWIVPLCESCNAIDEKIQ